MSAFNQTCLIRLCYEWSDCFSNFLSRTLQNILRSMFIRDTGLDGEAGFLLGLRSRLIGHKSLKKHLDLGLHCLGDTVGFHGFQRLKEVNPEPQSVCHLVLLDLYC